MDGKRLSFADKDLKSRQWMFPHLGKEPHFTFLSRDTMDVSCRSQTTASMQSSRPMYLSTLQTSNRSNANFCEFCAQEG